MFMMQQYVIILKNYKTTRESNILEIYWSKQSGKNKKYKGKDLYSREAVVHLI